MLRLQNYQNTLEHLHCSLSSMHISSVYCDSFLKKLLKGNSSDGTVKVGSTKEYPTMIPLDGVPQKNTLRCYS